jgi:hypothetical protein
MLDGDGDGGEASIGRELPAVVSGSRVKVVPEDPRAACGALSFDNLISFPKALLTERVSTL